MKSTLRIVIASLVALSATIIANAQTAEKKALTIEGAKKVIAAAVAYAKKNNAPGGVIAVVDDGGNLMALERLDGTFAAGANISIGKARTAALFKRPTKAFEDIIKNGRTAMVALPDSLFTPLQGGVPITVDGQIVGGVGVSGAASAQQDEELAIAGANAFSTNAMNGTTAPVSYFESKMVNAAFSNGAVLWMELTVATTWFMRATATNRVWLRFTRLTPTLSTCWKAPPRLLPAAPRSSPRRLSQTRSAAAQSRAAKLAR